MKEYFPVFSSRTNRRSIRGYHHYGKNGLRYTTLKFSYRPKKLFGRTIHKIRKRWYTDENRFL